ncbi:ABC transporter permease [Pelagibacterium halotolerans]|uniref:Binding-protein-dependent transport systems inner membrane component n=1 Tax=Pelagibacterium halotolerans (strain DSM 22347 / JCM 15775 / CGMCC 1.7692 / B2) TaxID=1082931 RepID=G4REP6_PELHB|nr:ABC transporter permease [Pelagibacterium halotolerans]AEQ50896.1 binding-protein-dependent transport systems inner membrane component [Pelagibacterium halotolerans B2]QJR19200.1 ABC transporter permease [Pelagibacterium halotolerans]SDZ99274.1 NitT/TauT family transport system permease protein [Pelagibacterium halotolerans]
MSGAISNAPGVDTRAPSGLNLSRFRHVATFWPPVLFLALLIMLWAVLSQIGVIPGFLLPAPGAIALEFVTNSEVLMRHASATAFEALAGFTIGNLAAIVGAALLSSMPVLRDAFYPYALISRAVPIVVFTPVVVVLLGRGLPPIIAIVSFAVYFPTFLNMMRGLKSPEPDYYEMLHSYSASPLQRLKMIEFPAAMPYLFAALKISASSAFIAALVTEWIGANTGLGYLVVVSSQYFRLPTMWAAIFTSAALTLTLLAVVHVVEHLLKRYTAASPDVGA